MSPAGSVRACAALCAVLLAACGYPEFRFAPADEADAGHDAPLDTTLADGDGDAAPVDSGHDATLDEGADSRVPPRDSGADAADTAIDAAIDTAIVDSAVADTAIVDSAAADSATGDAGTDAAADDGAGADADALDPCAMIDDFEDGDGTLLIRCGRNGPWFTYDDGADGGVQFPAPSGPFVASSIPGGRGASLFAGRTYGGGFTIWGSGMGFNLIDSGAAYDAHAYGGIAFWARTGATAPASLRFTVPDGDTDPRGGICTTATGGCYDNYGAWLSLDTAWTLYTLRFSDLRQGGWGAVAPGFNAAAIYGVTFQMSASQPFDVWIDDITFVP